MIVIKIGIVLLNILYCFFKLCPQQKKVSMISRQGNLPSVEFQMIEKKIKEQNSDISVVLLCKTLDGGVNSAIKGKVSYALHMITQMYHLATSKVVILDSYCILASVLKHKKSLCIIQMWHSMGTMKKFGYTALDTMEGTSSRLAHTMKMHQNYDYVFASADAYKDHLAKGFNCDIEKIITMPLPRLDLLKDEAYAEEIKQKIYKKYPMLREKKTIVYCPTFRKEEENFSRAVYELVKLVDKEKYNIVVKLHPLSKIVLDEFVISADEFSSFDMIFVADYFISDYSCIVYEAAVRDVPLYFYNFDMDLYAEDRGLAIDYEKELPGVISKNAREIIEAISEEEYDMEELRRFTHKYVEPTEHATEDIVKFVLKFTGR